jgi:hypothetical protein
MRAVILIAAAALGLAACGKTDQVGNATNAADGLTAQNAVSNDVTAIDAVTGEDANMAADVNFINESDLNVAASNGGSATHASSRPKPSTTPAPARAATNSTAEPAPDNTAAQ